MREEVSHPHVAHRARVGLSPPSSVLPPSSSVGGTPGRNRLLTPRLLVFWPKVKGVETPDSWKFRNPTNTSVCGTLGRNQLLAMKLLVFGPKSKESRLPTPGN